MPPRVAVSARTRVEMSMCSTMKWPAVLGGDRGANGLGSARSGERTGAGRVLVEDGGILVGRWGLRSFIKLTGFPARLLLALNGGTGWVARTLKGELFAGARVSCAVRYLATKGHGPGPKGIPV